MGDDDRTILFGKTKSGGVKPPYVVIVDGPHKGARFPLQEGVNVIGRLDECQVALDDQSVSRKHAEIRSSAEGWKVVDLQSKNGTHVNGSSIQESVVIGHKDLIRTGIYTLRLITQEIKSEEEMDVPSQDIGEWGTLMVGEQNADGDTALLGLKGKQGERDVTAPHSPLEDEEVGRTAVMPVATKSRRGLPKARLWVLLAVLFAGLLSAGLYFYWQYVLAPSQEAKKPPAPVSPTEPITIPLGPPEPPKPQTVPVFLDCVANPFPATIRFQEKEIGKTPLKLNVDLVPDQTYEVEATFDMAEIQEKYTDKLRFSVTADQSTVPLLFRAPIGTIKVTSLPRDVSFYLEGYYEYNKFRAHPVKLQNLVLNKPIYVPYGRYILELRQPKPVVVQAGNLVEDIVFRRELVIQEESPTFVLEVTEASLKQFPAEIRSIPLGADVFIDQQKVGQTPFVGTLPVGRHQLTLRKEGYFEISQEIAADINTPFKAEIPLKTSAAGEKLNLAKNHLNQGLNQEAIQVLSDVFSLNPTPGETAEARYLLGNIYLRLKDYQKALGYFEQAATHDSFKYLSRLGVAVVYAEQQQIQQALIPLVEVLLNAKDENVLREANNVLRKVSPLRSVIYIQSEPSGATVHLNDKKLEQPTPILLHELGLGSYRIRLEKTGFQPLDLTIDLAINEFNPVLAKLKPIAQ